MPLNLAQLGSTSSYHTKLSQASNIKKSATWRIEHRINTTELGFLLQTSGKKKKKRGKKKHKEEVNLITQMPNVFFFFSIQLKKLKAQEQTNKQTKKMVVNSKERETSQKKNTNSFSI